MVIHSYVDVRTSLNRWSSLLWGAPIIRRSCLTVNRLEQLSCLNALDPFQKVAPSSSCYVNYSSTYLTREPLQPPARALMSAASAFGEDSDLSAF